MKEYEDWLPYHYSPPRTLSRDTIRPPRIQVQTRVLPVEWDLNLDFLPNDEIEHEEFKLRWDHSTGARISAVWGRMKHLPTGIQVEVNQTLSSPLTQFYCRMLLTTEIKYLQSG